jgi:two-component system NarL family sensor kinase
MQRSLALTEQLGDPQQLINSLDALAQIEERAGQWPAALGYFRRSHALRDTLASDAVRRQASQLEAQYRSREQAQQLQSLRHEQADQQRALRQEQRLSTVYLALVLALAGAGALAFGLLRNRQRLARQRQELQAQRIQQLEQGKALLTAQAVLEGQEEERTRVARDLHDGLGGMLATVKLYLGTVRSRLELADEPARLFAQSVAHLDGSIAELRRVARNLMPEAMLTFGLARALQDLCDAVQQSAAVRVRLQTHGLEARLPPATEAALYRMVQELLTNVVRHAQARQVLVQLMRHAHELHLVVEDDGQGFDPELARSGVGLRSVRARAAYLGGRLEVQSAPGQGTSISLELSLAQATDPTLSSVSQ